MASKRRQRRKACEGKKQYPDKNAAQRGAYGLGRYLGENGMISADADQTLQVYRCTHCGFFHVGHDRSKGPVARSRKEMKYNAIR